MPPFIRAPAADFTSDALTTLANAQISADGVFAGVTNGVEQRVVELGTVSPSVTTAAAAGPITPSTELRLVFNLTNPSGGRTTSTVGTAQGQIMSEPTINADGLQLDGVDDHVVVPYGPGLLNTGHAGGVVVKLDRIQPTTTRQALLARGGPNIGGTNTRYFKFQVFGSRIQMRFWNGGGSIASLDSAEGQVVVGEWAMFTFWRNAASGAVTVRKNGVQIASSGSMGVNQTASERPLMIGCIINHNAADPAPGSPQPIAYLTQGRFAAAAYTAQANEASLTTLEADMRAIATGAGITLP